MASGPGRGRGRTEGQRHRGSAGFVRLGRAGARRAGAWQRALAAGAGAGGRGGGPDPAGPRLPGGVVATRRDHRAGAADAGGYREPPPLPQRAGNHGHASEDGRHAHRQRERHHRHRRDPLRRQRPPGRADRRDRGRRPAGAAVGRGRALHGQPAEGPERRAPAAGRGNHPRDRRHGGRGGVAPVKGRDAHQADRRAHGHGRGLRHGHRPGRSVARFAQAGRWRPVHLVPLENHAAGGLQGLDLGHEVGGRDHHRRRRGQGAKIRQLAAAGGGHPRHRHVRAGRQRHHRRQQGRPPGLWSDTLQRGRGAHDRGRPVREDRRPAGLSRPRGAYPPRRHGRQKEDEK